MASRYDPKPLKKNFRDQPAAALQGPPPTRNIATGDGPGQDQWQIQNANAREEERRVYEFLFKSDTPDMLPNGKNKADIPDPTNDVTRGPQVASFDTYADTNSSSSVATSSSALSNRVAHNIISPRRLRKADLADVDTVRQILSSNRPSNRPSLLAGSAPDMDIHDSHPPFRFTRAHEAPIANKYRQQRVEGSEEITALNLGNTDDTNPRMKLDREDTLYRSTTRGNILTKEPNRSYGLPLTQQQGRSYVDSQVRGLGGSVQRSNEVLSVQFDQSVGGNSGNIGGGRAFPHNTTLSNPWTTVQNNSEFAWFGGIPPECKISNLRPDVASYRPLCSPGHNESNPTQDKPALDPFAPYSVVPTVHGHPPLSTKNQHTTFGNLNMAHDNPGHATPTFHSKFGDIQQQEFPISVNGRFGHIQSGRQALVNNSGCHGPTQSVAAWQGSGFSGTNTSSRHSASSAAYQFKNPHNDYMTGLSRIMPFEQPYDAQMATKVGGQISGDRHSQDIEPHHRSELLEEVRAFHKSGKYELRDIYGHVVEFSGDQTGSRFIQTKLEQASSEEKDQVFSELLTNVRQLMSDVFGNYVIQKMFEYGNQLQKRSLASQMQGHVLKLSMHAYGCRCVQKALEHILTDQQVALIRELEGHVIAVVESQHGNHVIQKAVELIPGEHIRFIVDAHKNHVVRLAKHVYGCRIIQRMLEHCRPAAQRAILGELHSAIPSLIDDQYGNYVIQCIIKSCSGADRKRVVEFVQQQLLYYAKHKFASNVVEIAIEYAEERQRAEMCHMLSRPHPGNGMQSPVKILLNDQYGNYVIQTVLRHVQGDHMMDLAEAFRHHIRIHGKFGRSKQIVAMVETLNAVRADCSPSSVSTGLQTPQTPTSFHSGGGVEIPVMKMTDTVPPGFHPRGGRHRNTAP